MQPRIDALLRRWHRMLNLPRQTPPSWYRDRLREELQERRNAKTFLEKLSETSDVLFSISRARHDGFPIRNLPQFGATRHALAYTFMFAKYTLRWRFYRIAAKFCKAPHWDSVREVVNPGKDSNLRVVARRHNIHPEEFLNAGRQLRNVWPLMP